MSLIQNWHNSIEAKPFLNSLLKGPNRKSFGLLDAPSIPINLSYHVKTYRIWFRSGPMPVGKSATIHRLTGQFIHSEMKPTTGAQVSLVYWPGKCAVTQQIIMFKLELWEAGSGITGRFENLEQMDNPDAVVFIFSSLDRNSFDSLPDLIQQINSEVDNDPLKLCLATHADRYMAAEVPESEVRTFANRNNMNLFRTSNINENVRSNNTIDGASSIKDVGDLLFSFCDLLLKRDTIKQAITV